MNLLDALYLPTALVTAPWWARKTRSGWGERFGRIGALPAPRPGVPRVLIHAVSVGEVNTLRGLVPALSGRGCEVVVSASTDTGLARARALFAGRAGVWVVRFALDFSPAVRRFLDAVRPDAAALVELELWPNFVAACRARGVPVAVINGRLSARSFRGYRWLRPIIGPTFAALEFAAVQDDEYAARFEAMGVTRDRLHVTGSMKWDAVGVLAPGQTLPEAAQLASELGLDPGRPLVVAGSTAPIRAGGMGPACEEALLAGAVPAGVQLVCAPRKPEHFDAAFAALGGPGRCVRRSARTPAPPGTARFLLDTIGELRAAYALADVAVVGRSFGGLGGSDPIEPLALGRPTLTGPEVANFRSVVDRFAAAGAIGVVTPDGLPAAIARLLADPGERARMAEAGRACILANQGATERHAAMLDALARAAPGAAARLHSPA